MKNLYDEAKSCFLTCDPDEKLALSQELVAAWGAGQLEWKDGLAPLRLDVPGRLEKPVLVAASKVKKRGFKSVQQRAALLHALAHIELTAVNLCWDTVYRYRHMPKAFYDDWIKTAGEETQHFNALRARLKDMDYDYGDFPVHDELWQMAVITADDLMARMAIVHRVLEARALDVVPLSEKRFRESGDKLSANTLVLIANDEIGHVHAGARWYRYCCEQRKLDADSTFFQLIDQYMQSPPRGPFNYQARLRAGFSSVEMQTLERRDAADKKNRASKR